MPTDIAGLNLRRFFNVPHPSERPSIIADLQTEAGRARVTQELAAALIPWLTSDHQDSDGHVYYLGKLFGNFSEVVETYLFTKAAMTSLGEGERARSLRDEFEKGFAVGVEQARKRQFLSGNDCPVCRKT